MTTIVYLIVILIIAVLFYWKTVKLYNYTVGCFRNICDNRDIQEKYRLVVKGQEINNLRISTFGTMYIVVVVPEEIESKHFDEYLQSYLTFLEQAMSIQNLYGLVMTRKEKFILSSDDDVKNTLFYVKFLPILYKNTFGRFFFFSLTCFVSIILIRHFDAIDIVSNFIHTIKI